MKQLLLIAALLLAACGHQDQQPAPKAADPLAWATGPVPSTDTTNVPACPEHMHEVVTSVWGTKSCVND